MRRFLVLALTAGISLPIVACSNKNQASFEPVIIETLIKATESWNGDSFIYPRGRAQMTFQRITAQPGYKTPLHSHPQPGVVYIVKGTLSCETNDGQSLQAGPGDSFASPQDTVHYCENVGNDEAQIFVASAGAKGRETTIPIK
tara:strand:+ start:119 stop:550 length:432 start_codon:yes stop_codon:yes gene_type:complete